MKRSIRRSFTLVELLTVIAVIGILSAIGIGVYSTAQNKSRISATRALVENIANAFECAKNDVGYAPSSGSAWKAVSFDSDLNVSVGDSTPNSNFQNAFRKYIDGEMIRKFLENGESGNVVDSWGREIRYCYPGIANRTKCCVLSAGPDGKFGNNKDEDTSPSTSISAYKSSGEWNCDDVANF